MTPDPGDTGGPVDPFAGDPDDPVCALEALDPQADAERACEPLSPQDREQVLEDLEDLELFQALLTARGVKGLVVECDECDEPHWFGWDLMRANLRQLLDSGTTRTHEPAFSPDPSAYVSWDYARGFTDASLAG